MNSFTHFIFRITRYRDALTAGLALAFMLALTYSAWDFARNTAENEARIRFNFRAGQISDAIRGRILDYEQVLRGGVGLFAASTSVERDEWRAYVEHLRIGDIYPGIQGIGFALHVPAMQKARHEASVRAQGFPEYSIQPSGERAEYVSIIYIEPFFGRNIRAFGYDMFSEPTRRAAMERARDSGAPAISGKVTLVQEMDQDVQAGFLMYVPVYRNGLDTATPAQRRAALAGYVFSPFRMNNLLRGVLGEISDIRLELFDGAAIDANNLLYDSVQAQKQSPPSTQPDFGMVTPLNIHDRIWTLRATSLPRFEATIDHSRSRLVLGGGVAASALLTAIIWLLVTLRQRAVALAASMTSELRLSRERLGLALEGSELAFFDWDVITGQVNLSDRWNIILGGGAEPTITTVGELQKAVHPDDVPMLQERLRAVLAGKARFYRAEHRVRSHNGEWRWILSRAKVVERDAGGRAVRIAGTNADITASKEVERLKNEFIGTVSHELRTPLTAIVGGLALLREVSRGSLPPDAAGFLDMAERNSQRLATLINDILDIEKIESGRMEFRLEPVALRPFLETAIELNRMYAERYGVAFRLEEPVPEAAVIADRDRMLQVLTNLLSNAAKYSPHGQIVSVAATAFHGVVRIAVTDRGAGVPESFRDRIFQKFAQADSSDTRSKSGTGLGLSICKVIIESMGGRIDFNSVRGQGTTFYFELPAAGGLE